MSAISETTTIWLADGIDSPVLPNTGISILNWEQLE